MNTEDLTLFILIAEIGSPADIARQRNISPRDVNIALARLEDTLSCALVTRSALRLTLNEAGKAFLPHCKAALAALESGKAAALAQAPNPIA